MKLVIVESPAKAKTIKKYLGKGYEVLASFGHIRDLPSKNGSVLPDKDFEMDYQISSQSVKHVKEIADNAKSAEVIYLATDPDREGESISWHIVEVLKEKKALKHKPEIYRIVFNEITKKAVNYAVANPRYINDDLVNAQQARRAIDYLVGFSLSPILWRKLPGSRSAGRVQSVALRLICDREEEIEKFVSQEYWDITAQMKTSENKDFAARLVAVDGVKLDKLSLTSKEQTMAIVEELESSDYIVRSIEKKQQKRNPSAPFTTSSLQQEAARKLGFSTKKTMQIAQKLYEGIEIDGENVGLITYMRTDGVSLSKEAVEQTRDLIKQNFGEKYLPKEERIYKTKAKNAQEAHEAIRPTNITIQPAQIENLLEKDFFRLYELIWKRMVACQMEQAIIDIVSVEIDTVPKKHSLRATGSTISFDGFYVLYKEGVDDSEGDDESKILPIMHEKEKLIKELVLPKQHFTEPKPRYTEASLVKTLEELGIGRPSTYSSIISVIQDRKYVKLDKKRFFPEERGRIVTVFLSKFFSKYVEYDFTAQLENELDEIAEGKLNWKEFLSKFWHDFSNNVSDVSKINIVEIIECLQNLMHDHLFPTKVDGSDPKLCPKCSAAQLSLRLGKFGAFLACNAYPECDYTKQITNEENSEDDSSAPNLVDDKILGQADCGSNIYLKKGPYGWYVQLGEQADKKSKPKRASLPSGVSHENIDLKAAKDLLALPKFIGEHPETQKEIQMSIGKFGPYVKYDGKFFSIPKTKDPFLVNLEDALEIIKSSKK